MVENTYVDEEVEELVAMYPEECSQMTECDEQRELANTGISEGFLHEQGLKFEATSRALVQSLLAALLKLWFAEYTNCVENGIMPNEFYFQEKRRFLHDYNNAAAKKKLEPKGYSDFSKRIAWFPID